MIKTVNNRKFGEPFKVQILEDGTCIAQSVSISGVITQGKNLDELKKRCKSAMKAMLFVIQEAVENDEFDFYEIDDLRNNIDVRVNKKL